MSKGGKRYFNKNISGNWFMHINPPQTEQTREVCTSTGSMLAHGVPQPMTQREKRYPKIFINPEKKSTDRNYPFSMHDNRAALQDTIDGYDQGLGRKKCLSDEHRQHNSHLCLCHHDTLLRSGKPDHSAYQTDFLSGNRETETTGVTVRRFSRKHSARSQMNAKLQAGEIFMWFGRHDSNQNISLSVLANSNH